MQNFVISGAAGFIGSHACDTLLSHEENKLIGLDNLAYSGNTNNLPSNNENFKFIKCDISDPTQVLDALKSARVFFKNEPYSVVNFAAESHVDRSIKSGVPFVKANVLGTQVLLECAVKLGAEKFLQVSTDEVYGSFETDSALETSQLNPSSPYASSKASADLMVLAYFHTHGFPITITRCVNNFGTRQLNEKLIPRFMYLSSKNLDLPIYGSGSNIREWIPVSMHVARIVDVLMKGRPGEIYNIGSNYRKSNLEIAKLIIQKFETSSKVCHIEDRLGHDQRYAVNSQKGIEEFGWLPDLNLEIELEATMNHYWAYFKKMSQDEKKIVEEVEKFYE